MATAKPFPSQLHTPAYDHHRDLNLGSSSSSSSSSRAFRSNSETEADGTDADLARFASGSSSLSLPSISDGVRRPKEVGDGADVLALLEQPSPSDWEDDLLASRSAWKTAYENSVPGDQSPTSLALLSSVEGLNEGDLNVLVDYLSAGRYTDDVWGLPLPESVKGVLESAKGKEREDKTVQRLQMVLRHLWATAESTPLSTNAKTAPTTKAPGARASSQGPFDGTASLLTTSSTQLLSDTNLSTSLSGSSRLVDSSGSTTYSYTEDPRRALPFSSRQAEVSAFVRGDVWGGTDGDGPVQPVQPVHQEDEPAQQDEEQAIPPFRDFMQHKMQEIARGRR